MGALVPQTIDEAWRLSEAFAKAGILPRGISGAPQVMLIICGGAEVGFGPFQSLQSFYLVNNRLALWGDAIPALLWSNGFKLKEWFENSDAAYPDTMVAKCVVTRPDGSEIEGEFSVADAKEAKLWSKDGPWQTAKKRMLKMRARAFAARDGAPDVLRGVQIREEVEDYDVITEVRTAPQTLTAEFTERPKDPEPKPRRRRATPEPETPAPAAQEGASAAEDDDAGAVGPETQTAAQAASEALAGDDLPDDVKGDAELEQEIDAEIERAASEPAGDAEEADEGEEEEEEADDDFPSEFKSYIGQVEEAASWVDVKKAMATFYQTELFKGMSPEQQNQIRANTWDAVIGAGDMQDKPDQAFDVSAFRLWIEWVEDPEAIQGTLAVLEGQPAFSEKEPSFKDAIRKAVASRLERLQG